MKNLLLTIGLLATILFGIWYDNHCGGPLPAEVRQFHP
jgi:hypothetical protein